MTRLVGRRDSFCLGVIGWIWAARCVRLEALLVKQASDMNKLWFNNTRSSLPLPQTHLAIPWPCYCHLSVCKQRF